LLKAKCYKGCQKSAKKCSELFEWLQKRNAASCKKDSRERNWMGDIKWEREDKE